MKNLKQPQNIQSFELPNLCATSPLLFLILFAELCVLVWQLAEGSFSWATFGLRSGAVLWMVVLSAAVLCALRPRLRTLNFRLGWTLCFLAILCTSLLVLFVSRHWLLGLPFSLGDALPQTLAIAIVAAMGLRFVQLQQTMLSHNRAEMHARMDALQARIRPHFLFNSLNTVAALIETKPKDAEVAVENLARLFRANLQVTSSFVPLQEELTLVRGYLALERWRLAERLQVKWQVSVHDERWPVPVLCLQPLVENAVVHGISPSEAGGQIDIAILQTPRLTTMSVSNPVTGSLPTHEGHGVGLENVRKRLRVLYGEAARLTVDKSHTTYKVTVSLPKTQADASFN